MSSSSHEKADLEKSHIEQQEGFHLEHLHGKTADVKKVVQVYNANFAAATAQSKLSPWSKDSLVLFWCMFVSFLCACANGYDGSLMTAINDMTYYQNQFNSGRVGSSTGLIFSMYTIGGIVGPIFSGPTADQFGRRGGMFMGGLFICIGVAVIASSNVRAQFIGGRFILGFGVSFMTTAAPSYCVEICPPQWRGRMTGFYNCGWFGGSIPAAGITLGTQKMKSNLSWRLPLVFQAVPSVVVMIAVFFLPESPRWLLAHGQEEKARAFLTKYHGAGDPNSAVVELEWLEFKDQIALDGSDKRWWDYSELFNTSSARWRSLQVILMGVCGQFSGNGLGYFNTQIYAAVGYDQYMQFVLNLASSFVSAGGAGCGVALADRMPRRKVLVIGTFLTSAMLAANGALSQRWAHETVKYLPVGKGAVASFMFFNIIYSFTYTPLQALYPVECLQTTARAKGMAMYAAVVSAISFINLYCTPIALGTIQYHYVYIFVGWDIIESVLWYLFGVETVGRTLEELEEIFKQRYPPRASLHVDKLAVKETGEIAVLDE